MLARASRLTAGPALKRVHEKALALFGVDIFGTKFVWPGVVGVPEMPPFDIIRPGIRVKGNRD
jgi:hypothetical protein